LHLRNRSSGSCPELRTGSSGLRPEVDINVTSVAKIPPPSHVYPGAGGGQKRHLRRQNPTSVSCLPGGGNQKAGVTTFCGAFGAIIFKTLNKSYVHTYNENILCNFPQAKIFTFLHKCPNVTYYNRVFSLSLMKQSIQGIPPQAE